MMEATLSNLAGTVLLYVGLLFVLVRLIFARSVNSRFEIGDSREASIEGPTAATDPERPGRGDGWLVAILTRLAWIAVAFAALVFIDTALLSVIGNLTQGFLYCAICVAELDDLVPSAVAAGPQWHAVGLFVVLLCAGIALSLMRTLSVLPALLGLLGCIALALGADVVFRNADLQIAAVEKVIRLTGLILMASSVLGIALAGRLRVRPVAIAAGLYVFALVFRLLSAELLIGLWPLLFDASRVALLTFGVMFPTAIVSVLCFIGPVAFRRSSGDVVRVWGRHVSSTGTIGHTRCNPEGTVS